MSSIDQGNAATDPSQLQGSGQGVGGGYDGMTQASQTDSGMGGGAGAQGSGVAGGYSSNADQQQTNTAGAGGEKQDWLDKGLQFAGKKAGVNVVSSAFPILSARGPILRIYSRARPMLTRRATSPTRSSTNTKVSLTRWRDV